MGYRRKLERKEMVKRFRTSGMTVPAFAKAEGVSVNSVRRWLSEAATDERRFVRLVAKEPDDSMGGTEVSMPPDSSGSGGGSGIAIGVGGVRVHVARGFDAAVLAGVLGVLRVQDGRP
jgi:hypothetical protein